MWYAVAVPIRICLYPFAVYMPTLSSKMSSLHVLLCLIIWHWYVGCCTAENMISL
uniref:Uncharacterized protein n=1 Tax=Arundo donax TaxID=35708 RepID=A0A0A9DG55_ARUDO